MSVRRRRPRRCRASGAGSTIIVAAHPDGRALSTGRNGRMAVEEGCRQRGHYLIAEGRGGLDRLPAAESRCARLCSAMRWSRSASASAAASLADDPATAAGFGRGRLGAGGRQRLPLDRAARRRRCRRAGPPRPESMPISARRCREGDEAILRAMKRRQRSIRRAREHRSRGPRRPGRGRSGDALPGLWRDGPQSRLAGLSRAACSTAMLDRFGEDADILTVLQGRQAAGQRAQLLLPRHRHALLGRRHRRGSRELSRERDDVLRADVPRPRGAAAPASISAARRSAPAPMRSRRTGGSSREPLVYAVRTADGAAPRSVNPMEPKYRLQVALWKRLPLPVANRIGPHIARGLG